MPKEPSGLQPDPPTHGVPAAPRLQLTGITKRYPGVVANGGVSLTVQPGEIHAVLGENGAGKSTLMKIIYGAVKPDAGEVRFDGQPVHVANPQEARQLGVAMVFQHFSLFDALDVAENIQIFGGIYGLSGETIRERSAELLPRLGLEGMEDRRTGSLPLGYKQRLALGVATLHHPKIVFLDEPTGGVDPVARRRFWDLMYEIAAGGTTVFVTTHYMDEAEYCERLSIMVAGRIVALGQPSALKKEWQARTMEDVFLKVVQR